MASKHFIQYQELTKEELRLKSKELRLKVFNLQLQKVAGKLEKPHVLDFLKKEIARCETRLSHISQTSTIPQATKN